MRVLVTAALASLLALSGTAIFGSALSGPAHAAASAVVIDARSGSVLHADNADTRQNAPALPKLMTIYLMFEAFEAGTVKPETNIFVSGTAIRQPQPTLGLNHFDTISAGDALNALVTVNANDAAAVLAEFLAGSEARFVAQMNAKAKALELAQGYAPPARQEMNLPGASALAAMRMAIRDFGKRGLAQHGATNKH